MPSPDKISVDLPLLTLGGQVTQYGPQALPSGASPAAPDVKFSGLDPSGDPVTGGVCTRDGLTPFYANPFTGNPSVNYLKTFIDSQNIRHLLSLDSLGVVRDESPCPEPPGVPLQIGTVLANLIAQSDAILNRECIAFSSTVYPAFGADLPRQWDGQFFDRVSQSGPGAPPVVVDGSPLPPFTVAANGAFLQQFQVLGISMDTTGLVTLITDVGFFATDNILQENDSILVAGVGVGGYNGTWIITSVGPGTIQFHTASVGLAASSGGTATVSVGVIQPNPALTNDEISLFTVGLNAALSVPGWLGSWTIRGFSLTDSPTGIYLSMANNVIIPTSGGGGISAPGSITAGTRQLAVCFQNRHGYITKPSPFVSWTAGGSVQANLSSIPTGPSDIVARIIIVTGTIVPPAVGGDFFFLDGPVFVNSALTFPSFVINDNVTTTYTINFLDAVLENGTNATNLYNLELLGECANFCTYSERLFTCGELNMIQNVLNFDFNGGWALGSGPGGADVPLGWINPGGVSGVGGSRLQDGGVWLDAYRVTGGSGVGQIQQGLFQDFLMVPILQGLLGYSLRVVARTSVPGFGTWNFVLFSPTQGTLGVASVQPTDNVYRPYTVSFPLMPSVIPADTTLSVQGFATAGQTIDMDRIQLFPTLNPYRNTSPRGSYALEPESFDGTTGFCLVGSDDGYPVRALFKLLDNKLYFVKEKGLFGTQDDGVNEPSSWTVNTVSATVGTSSARGVGVGESWAIIADKTGIYIFYGSEPVKISQEIQPDWDSVNWNAAATIYVIVDTTNKRIHVGAPINGATSPNCEFVCDFSQLANAEGQVSAQDIIAHPQAYYSVYNPTRIVAPGKSRKWSIWHFSANCAAITIRSDGNYDILRGNGVANGQVWKQDDTATSDYGQNAIAGNYQTAFFPQVEDAQALQLGFGRMMLKYLRGYVSGVGSMSWEVIGQDGVRTVQLTPLPLKNPAPWDFEKNVNFTSERMSLIFGTNAIGSWFHLEKLAPTIQRDVMTPIRGNW